MKHIALTIALLAVFFFPCFADQANQLFEEANGAYQAKKYNEAADLYEQLLAEGYCSAELEYNLGNAYFRQNELGRAILHFERASLLSPNDGDIRHNLKTAKSKVVDEFSLLPKFFLTNTWQQMRMSMSATAWGIMALVIWWGGMAGMGISPGRAPVVP